MIECLGEWPILLLTNESILLLACPCWEKTLCQWIAAVARTGLHSLLQGALCSIIRSLDSIFEFPLDADSMAALNKS